MPVTATGFPFMPQGGTRVLERYSYATSVMVSENLSEQRRAQRIHPEGGIEFEVLEEGVLAQRLDALIYGHQTDQWAVPLWPYRTVTALAITAGDVSVPVTDSRIFLDVDRAKDVVGMLWKSETDFELLDIHDETSSVPLGTYLALNTGVARDWPAGSVIVACRLGYLSSRVELPRYSQGMWGGTLAWDFTLSGSGNNVPNIQDPANDPIYGDGFYGTMNSEPGRISPVTQFFPRGVQVIGNPLGPRTTSVFEVAPPVTRAFLWQGENPWFVRGWLDQRMGRRVPFWLPPFDAEVTLAAPAAAGATTIVILAQGYTANLFPQSGARRYLQWRFPNGDTFHATVGDAVDNGDGTETLTLTAGLDQDVTPETLCGFRRFVRLDSDEVQIEHWTQEWVEVTLQLRELPLEAPVVPI